MLRLTRLALASVAALQILPLTSFADDAGGKKNGSGQKEKPKADAKKGPFAVVGAGADVKVLPQSEVPAFRREVSQKYTESVKAYDQARALAAKAKQKFTQPRPVKPEVKVLAQGLATQEEAEKKLAEIREKKAKEKPKGGKEKKSEKK